jgi:hypothetical protein
MPEDAVNVSVSPLWSAAVTPTVKVIDAGTSFATTLDGTADVHVSAVLAAITIEAALEPTPVVWGVAIEETATVNATVVTVSSTGFVARPPVHVIVRAPATIPAPTVRVRMSWLPLIPLPSTAIAAAAPATVHSGAFTPTAQSE